MTIHMSFEQLRRKHLGATSVADRRAEGILVVLDIVKLLTDRWFHLVPLCRLITAMQPA
jgi:hypothetical protein